MSAGNNLLGNLLGYAGAKFGGTPSGNKPKFFDALQTKNLRGENNMPTHSSSGNYVVDLFFKMGGFRKNPTTSIQELVSIFFAAYGENPNLALKALLHLRDVRGGMGERNSGKILLYFLAKSHPEIVRQLLPHFPEYGRWDDLLVLLDTPVETEVLELIKTNLVEGNELCAKWMPRENKAQGHIAKYLTQRFGLTPKKYRQMLAGLSGSLVERKMCQNMWEGINFQHVPSVAMKNYRKAFSRHQPERFVDFLGSVKKGEAKINTGALSPVDIVQKYIGDMHWSHRHIGNVDETLEVLWSNLPDVVPPELSFICVCDLSGSMLGTPMAVSIALGIYLSQRNSSIFKDGFITFSQTPSFVQLTGKTLLDNLNIMRAVNMAENTDLEATFRLILSSAVRAKLSPEDMPQNLIIISDMQFDACVGKGNRLEYVENPVNNTTMEMIDRMYQEAGYQRPGIIFWNVRTSTGVPAKTNDLGVALVSGYSPNLLSSVLTKDYNPLSQVQAILNNGRYDVVNSVI